MDIHFQVFLDWDRCVNNKVSVYIYFYTALNSVIKYNLLSTTTIQVRNNWNSF